MLVKALLMQLIMRIESSILGQPIGHMPTVQMLWNEKQIKHMDLENAKMHARSGEIVRVSPMQVIHPVTVAKTDQSLNTPPTHTI